MKLIALHLLYASENSEKAIFLSSAHNLSSFGYLQRKTVREMSVFMARTVATRVRLGARDIIEEDGLVAFAFREPDMLTAVAITDSEYPNRVGFKLLTDLLKNFRLRCPESLWSTQKKDDQIDYKDDLRKFLEKYEDPTTFDAATKTHEKVEATKEIMRKNIDQILANNESLDVLVQRSEDVSEQSKAMFQSSKKMKKSCCKMS